MVTDHLDKRGFRPDYAVPPGDTLAEALEALGMSQAELAQRLAVSAKHVSELVNAKTPLTAEMALKLESATGVPASLWANLESRYREHLARQNRLATVGAHLDWAKRFPLAFLRRQGAIAASARSPAVVVELCQFFGVATPESWDDYYATAEVCFRTSTKLKPDRFATASWLRLSHVRAQAIVTAPFDPNRFHVGLSAIRALTNEPPEQFVPTMSQLCAGAGVAFVLLPAPDGCRASGAVMWLRHDKALLALSLRHKTDDHFWFSFFHEAKHVLEHDREAVILDTPGAGGDDDPREARANVFASEALIPPIHAARLKGLTSAAAVKSFATEIGIAPGIVVGQLQHSKHISFSQMNELKRKFVWAE